MSITLAESLALAGIDDLTRATLRQTWPMIRESVPSTLEAAMAPAAAKATGPGQPTRAQLETARQIQARHWEALFAAEFDEGYAASLREVAAIHAKVGLDPCWLIAGYMTTLTELHSLVLAAHGGSMMTCSARSRLGRAIRAVDHAVLFDLQLCISAYSEQVAMMAREKLMQVARHRQPPTPAAAQVPAGRQTGNESFVAALRRTFHLTSNVPAMPGRQAVPSVSVVAGTAATRSVPAPRT